MEVNSTQILDFKRKIEQEDRVYAEECIQLMDKKKQLDFQRYSMLSDQSIKNCTFSNYIPHNNETKYNLSVAQNYAKDYLDGKVFNLMFAGECGTGKTHLAYSVAQELVTKGNKSVLMITISQLIRKVKSTWNNKNPSFTEDELINDLTKVDFLILDDLGAELGSLSSDRKATDFINRLLFDVLDGRQGKSTIMTTNLTGEGMVRTYDKRIVSRMLNALKTIRFVDTKDYRRQKVAF